MIEQVQAERRPQAAHVMGEDEIRATRLGVSRGMVVNKQKSRRAYRKSSPDNFSCVDCCACRLAVGKAFDMHQPPCCIYVQGQRALLLQEADFPLKKIDECGRAGYNGPIPHLLKESSLQ